MVSLPDDSKFSYTLGEVDKAGKPVVDKDGKPVPVVFDSPPTVTDSNPAAATSVYNSATGSVDVAAQGSPNDVNQTTLTGIIGGNTFTIQDQQTIIGSAVGGLTMVPGPITPK